MKKCRDCKKKLEENEKIVCKECEECCLSLDRKKEELKLKDVQF